MADPAHILVIRLGAFGNMVQSFWAFAAIRAHHAGADITLLTTAPYADWMAASPWFDHVLVDERPAWWHLPGILRLGRMLRQRRFERVYDLQTSARSSWYFRLFPRHARPDWSGIARGCSLPDADPHRDRLHDLERQAGQLRQAGISALPDPDLSWLRGEIAQFGITGRFALLAPGSSAHRRGKRWPAGNYRALAQELRQKGILPVIVGGVAEHAVAATIPEALDLTGQTSFGDLADLGRAACFAVGNDTGPMHLLAAVGSRSVVLFSNESDPELCAPRGAEVTILRRPELSSLSVREVRAALPAESFPA
jgi:ADP-heptose:LPS heptosyltransferase